MCFYYITCLHIGTVRERRRGEAASLLADASAEEDLHDENTDLYSASEVERLRRFYI